MRKEGENEGVKEKGGVKGEVFLLLLRLHSRGGEGGGTLLTPVDRLLKGPPYGHTKKWRETNTRIAQY